jgi:hypothetical protein
MNKLTKTLLALSVVAGLSSIAFGQTEVFSEDFGTITDGTSITTSNTNLTYVRVGNQGGSIESVNPSSFGSGASALISGPTGGSLNGLGVQSGLNFTDVPQIIFSADLRLTHSAGTVVIGLGSGTSFTGNGTFATAQGLFWLQFNGTTFERRTSAAWETMGSVTVDTNYTLVVDVNREDGTMSVFLNGILFAEDVAVTTSAVNPDAFRIYSITGSNIEVDNITLTAVPEPAAFTAIFGVLAFGFVLIRRRLRA